MDAVLTVKATKIRDGLFHHGFGFAGFADLPRGGNHFQPLLAQGLHRFRSAWIAGQEVDRHGRARAGEHGGRAKADA